MISFAMKTHQRKSRDFGSTGWQTKAYGASFLILIIKFTNWLDLVAKSMFPKNLSLAHNTTGNTFSNSNNGIKIYNLYNHDSFYWLTWTTVSTWTQWRQTPQNLRKQYKIKRTRARTRTLLLHENSTNSIRYDNFLRQPTNKNYVLFL